MSPVNFDETIIRDLLASYSQQLGAQVLSGCQPAADLP